MQPDPAHIAETRAWFFRAAEDLRAADHEFTAVPPLLADIAFHCQQAAEKAFNGFLTWHNDPFRYTHSLEEIGEATGWQKHYADVRIMPLRVGNPVCAAGIAAMESA